MNRLQKQIKFLKEIDALKEIMRRSLIMSGARYENTAEHSWHLAMMVLTLHEHANEPIDVGHTMKLVLVHDIVEIDAGDTYAYDVVGYEDKQEREQRAAERLFGYLPEDQMVELMGLWHEFEARETAEAKFANAVDRLIPLLHNYENDGESWREHGVYKWQVIDRCQIMADGSAALWEVGLGLIDNAARQGWIIDNE
ncbi:MAG: HD domain-containing protein [Anaerolineales bacterium]|nr:HD domain-containing protein [Anaerolineales bacterium]